MPAGPTGSEKVRAWDLPTRLFHWTLVLLFANAWVSFQYSHVFNDHNLVWHRWNGYAILVLIIWRLLWGFLGSSTSRFRSFVRWPWVAAGYGIDLLKGRDRHFLGHNPLGTYMIIALLALVAGQGILGLFTLEHNDTVAGPLKRLLSDAWVTRLSYWHRTSYNYILIFIALHVIANLGYQLVKKDPLITGMVTGKKPVADYEDFPEATIVDRPMVRALLCLVIAVLIFVGVIMALGGRLI